MRIVVRSARPLFKEQKGAIIVVATVVGFGVFCEEIVLFGG